MHDSHDSCITTVALISINFATAHLWLLQWCPAREIEIRGNTKHKLCNKKCIFPSLTKKEVVGCYSPSADAASLPHFRFVFTIDIPLKPECRFCLHRFARPHLDAAERHVRSCQRWTGIRCGLAAGNIRGKREAENRSTYTQDHQIFSNDRGNNN